MEPAIVDVYYFFKTSAAQCDSMKAEQKVLGLPENVLLRHLSLRRLTLGPAVACLIEQFLAVKNVVISSSTCRSGGQVHDRLKKAFSDKGFCARLHFVKVSNIFTEFLSL